MAIAQPGSSTVGANIASDQVKRIASPTKPLHRGGARAAGGGRAAQPRRPAGQVRSGIPAGDRITLECCAPTRPGSRHQTAFRTTRRGASPARWTAWSGCWRTTSRSCSSPGPAPSSSSGYALLGYVIEKVTTGQRYDYLGRRCCGRWGSRTQHERDGMVVASRAYGYGERRGTHRGSVAPFRK